MQVLETSGVAFWRGGVEELILDTGFGCFRWWRRYDVRSDSNTATSWNKHESLCLLEPYQIACAEDESPLIEG